MLAVRTSDNSLGFRMFEPIGTERSSPVRTRLDFGASLYYWLNLELSVIKLMTVN